MKTGKNLRRVAIAVSVFAALCLLFAACDDTVDPGNNDGGNGDGSFKDNYEYHSTIQMHWYENYGTIGYAIFNKDWMGSAPNYNGPAVMALPAGSYFRVEFENLHYQYDDQIFGEWPELYFNASHAEYQNFKDHYLTFDLRGHDKPFYFIELTGFGPIDTDGKGEAFFAVDPIKDFIQANPDAAWQTNYHIGYDKYNLTRGDADGCPKIIESAEKVIDVQAWIPKQQ